MKAGLNMGDEEDDDEDEDDAQPSGKEVWGQLKSRANALRHLVSRDPLAADVKLTLFACAVFSHRYAQVAYPLPKEYAGPIGINQLTEALDAAPAMRLLLTGGSASMLAPQRSLQLVEWLLRPPAQPNAPGGNLRALPRPPPVPDAPTPNYLFQVENPHLDERWRKVAKGKETLVAFLGHSLDVFHSIVHRGLITGGEEIIMRRTLREALQDSIPGYGLGSSEIGSRLRCVVECELLKEAQGPPLKNLSPATGFVLRDGSLARVSRLYVFQAPGEMYNESYSNKMLRVNRAMSSNSNSTTPLKLPEFRFEVETTSSHRQSTENPQAKVSSPVTAMQTPENPQPTKQGGCDSSPSINNTLLTDVKSAEDGNNTGEKQIALDYEGETDKTWTLSETSSVVLTDESLKSSDGSAGASGPLYSKIKPLDPIVPSMLEEGDGQCSDGSNCFETETTIFTQGDTSFERTAKVSAGCPSINMSIEITEEHHELLDNLLTQELSLLDENEQRTDGQSNNDSDENKVPSFSFLKILKDQNYSFIESHGNGKINRKEIKEKMEQYANGSEKGSATSIATWAESECPSEMKLWTTLTDRPENELSNEEVIDTQSVASQESDVLRRDFEKHVLEPIRTSRASESRGKRLIILLLQSPEKQ